MTDATKDIRVTVVLAEDGSVRVDRLPFRTGQALVFNEETDPAERAVVERIHDMYASGMSQKEISNAPTNERVFRRNSQWFPVVIRRELAALEQGFPAEPIPDGQFRSRSKQFRRSRKVDRGVT